MSKINNFIKYWLPVVLWMAFIFSLSHQPGLKSDLPAYWDFIFRKAAHILEYAVLAFLLIRALQSHHLSKKQILISAVVLAVLYAVSDEYHQTFILERTGVIQDIFIDSIGILLTICWFVLYKVGWRIEK